MRISTKGRYGTRAMVELAGSHGRRRVSASEISEHQDISLKYLEAILSSLKAAGLIFSERGKHGGYALARPPAEISLYDVLRPLEDTLTVVHCVPASNTCSRLETCVTREVWVRLQEATEKILRGTSLADLLARREVLETEQRTQVEAEEHGPS